MRWRWGIHEAWPNTWPVNNEYLKFDIYKLKWAYSTCLLTFLTRSVLRSLAITNSWEHCKAPTTCVQFPERPLCITVTVLCCLWFWIVVYSHNNVYRITTVFYYYSIYGFQQLLFWSSLIFLYHRVVFPMRNGPREEVGLRVIPPHLGGQRL